MNSFDSGQIVTEQDVHNPRMATSLSEFLMRIFNGLGRRLFPMPFVLAALTWGAIKYIAKGIIYTVQDPIAVTAFFLVRAAFFFVGLIWLTFGALRLVAEVVIGVVGMVAVILFLNVFYLISVTFEFLSQIPKTLVELSYGWSWRSFSRIFFISERTWCEVLEPALTDMRKERFEAITAGSVWHSRVVLVRGCWSLVSAVLAQALASLARRVYGTWR